MISVEDESGIRARVVAAIGQKGWSLRHASLQAGMAEATLGKYVRAETRSLSAVHLANLAEALGVGFMDLLKGAPWEGVKVDSMSQRVAELSALQRLEVRVQYLEKWKDEGFASVSLRERQRGRL